MAELPLVSVVIPTYNHSALLRETVDSVLAQTYPAIEVIVVDDGSPDDTHQVMAAYVERYPDRLRYLRQANAGGTAARNTGLTAAGGQFINFVDHDDLFLPEKIARQMDLFMAQPELGLVHCGYYRMDKAGRYLDIINDLPAGDVRVELVQRCFLWSGAPLIRSSVLDEVGPFDISVWSSDADLWLRIALAGYHFGCVQEPLGAYRILTDSSMADVTRTESMDMAILQRVFADPRLPEAARQKEAQAYFNQRFWLGFRYYTLNRGEDARRNLRLAFRYRPEVLGNTYDLLRLVYANVLDPRVGAPLQFLEAVFPQFPEEMAAVVAPRLDYLRAWVRTGLALRMVAYGEPEEASRLLDEALGLDPSLLKKSEDFAARVSDAALRLPVEPHEFIDAVFNSLPPAASGLKTIRRKVHSQVCLGQAFREYWRGRPGRVPGQVLKAARYAPGMLLNRGVLSIYARSLRAKAAGPITTGGSKV